ncbi:hypothetical protein Aduo_012607 [Ancylostoma duodenale]
MAFYQSDLKRGRLITRLSAEGEQMLSVQPMLTPAERTGRDCAVLGVLDALSQPQPSVLMATVINIALD